MTRAIRSPGVLVLFLGALAVVARADWRVITGVDAGPMDVWIRDGGLSSPAVFSTFADDAGFLVVDDPAGDAGVTSTLQCTECRGTWISGDGGTACLNVLQKDDGFWRDCAGNTASTMGSGSGIWALSSRATEHGSVYAGGLFLEVQVYHGPRSVPVDNWLVAGEVCTFPPVLAAASRGADDHALVVRRPEGSYLDMNASVLLPSRFLFSGGVPVWADLQVLPNGFLRGVAVGDGGVEIITYDLDAGSLQRQIVPRLDGGSYYLSAAALRGGMGDQYGDGFGFLLVPTPGFSNVYSAIPDPRAPGTWWVPTTVPPPPVSPGAVYDGVRCIDSTYCVLVSSGSVNTNLVAYRNANPPWVEGPAFMLDEGASDVALGLDAGDPDGDAVFVTWEPGASAGTYLSALAPDPNSHDGMVYRATAIGSNPALCGAASRDVSVDVVVSDGVAAHVRRDAGFIRVRRTSAPLAPSTMSFQVPAGSPSATYDVPYPPPLCAVASAQSSIVVEEAPPPTPHTLSLGPGVVRVTFQPPRVWCSADAGHDRYNLILSDNFLLSDAGTVTFDVLPWGPPEAPFDGGRVAFQDAGASVTYGPDFTHLCADAGGFPGTDTTWTWTWSTSGDAGPPSVLRSDLTPLPRDGGVSPTATVAAPDCVDGTVDFQAFHTTRGGGPVGATGGLTVNVSTTLAPLSSGSASLTASADGGTVSGQIDLGPGVNCPALRMADADVTLLRDGGIVSTVTAVPVPGPYQFPPLGLCGGGQFLVEATIRDSTGSLGPLQQALSLPLLSPGFSSLDVPDFQISCGDAGFARATASFGVGQCPTSQVTWASSGGVAVVSTSGNPADLFISSTDFGGLIGMPVDVTATATTETGQASMSRRVLVRTAPFISVAYRTDTPVASEARVLGVEVTLTNNTACDVSGIEWHETLDGMSWIEGSVQSGDGGVGAALDGGELVVPGLSLAAGGSLTLRYSARPRLFGTPRPSGMAVLRTVPVSDSGWLIAGEGTCGCGSAAGAWPALALVAAALLSRRRLRARS